MFDCATCRMAQAQSVLRPENAEAWAIFQMMARRFVMEFQIGPEVLRQCVRDADPMDVVDLIERLSLIFDAVCPPGVSSPDGA